MSAPDGDGGAAPVIIVKRAHAEAHGDGHHGGAWKVAYADFATAMMAFFMLLWIMNAVTEKQRKGIADYFAPTLVKPTPQPHGRDGVMMGQTAPGEKLGAVSGNRMGGKPSDEERKLALEKIDVKAFALAAKAIDARIASNSRIRDLREQVRYTLTREGLRIEVIDRAGFSMFELGTDKLVPRAAELMSTIAQATRGLPNPVAIRGHTDALQYAAGGAMNNWRLSSGRAEATRAVFAAAGIAPSRFARIEGVADTEPFVAGAPEDPRNRRITVTLLFRDR